MPTQKHYDYGDLRNGDHRQQEIGRPNVDVIVTQPLRKLSAEDFDFAQLWGNKIGLQIALGNREAVDQMVVAGFEARQTTDNSGVLETPLTQVGIELSVCNSLEGHLKALTLGDVLGASMDDLLAVPNLSWRRLLAVYAAIAAFSTNRLLQAEKGQ